MHERIDIWQYILRRSFVLVILLHFSKMVNLSRLSQHFEAYVSYISLFFVAKLDIFGKVAKLLQGLLMLQKSMWAQREKCEAACLVQPTHGSLMVLSLSV